MGGEFNSSTVISIRNEQNGTEMTKLITTCTSSAVPNSSQEPEVVININNVAPTPTQLRFPSRHLLEDNGKRSPPP